METLKQPEASPSSREAPPSCERRQEPPEEVERIFLSIPRPKAGSGKEELLGSWLQIRRRGGSGSLEKVVNRSLRTEGQTREEERVRRSFVRERERKDFPCTRLGSKLGLQP